MRAFTRFALISILLLQSACFSGGAFPRQDSRNSVSNAVTDRARAISNPSRTAAPTEYPWLGLLYKGSTPLCQASLIAPNVAVTAGSCTTLLPTLYVDDRAIVRDHNCWVYPTVDESCTLRLGTSWAVVEKTETFYRQTEADRLLDYISRYLANPALYPSGPISPSDWAVLYISWPNGAPNIASYPQYSEFNATGNAKTVAISLPDEEKLEGDVRIAGTVRSALNVFEVETAGPLLQDTDIGAPLIVNERIVGVASSYSNPTAQTRAHMRFEALSGLNGIERAYELSPPGKAMVSVVPALSGFLSFSSRMTRPNGTVSTSSGSHLSVEVDGGATLDFTVAVATEQTNFDPQNYQIVLSPTTGCTFHNSNNSYTCRLTPAANTRTVYTARLARGTRMGTAPILELRDYSGLLPTPGEGIRVEMKTAGTETWVASTPAANCRASLCHFYGLPPQGQVRLTFVPREGQVAGSVDWGTYLASVSNQGYRNLGGSRCAEPRGSLVCTMNVPQAGTMLPTWSWSGRAAASGSSGPQTGSSVDSSPSTSSSSSEDEEFCTATGSGGECINEVTANGFWNWLMSRFDKSATYEPSSAEGKDESPGSGSGSS